VSGGFWPQNERIIRAPPEIAIPNFRALRRGTLEVLHVIDLPASYLSGVLWLSRLCNLYLL